MPNLLETTYLLEDSADIIGMPRDLAGFRGLVDCTRLEERVFG
jgi:hypothetical protein